MTPRVVRTHKICSATLVRGSVLHNGALSGQSLTFGWGESRKKNNNKNRQEWVLAYCARARVLPRLAGAEPHEQFYGTPYSLIVIHFGTNRFVRRPLTQKILKHKHRHTHTHACAIYRRSLTSYGFVRRCLAPKPVGWNHTECTFRMCVRTHCEPLRG